MKRRTLLGLFLVYCLTACGEKAVVETPKAGVTPHKLRIALVMKTLTNPFFVAMEQGARRAEREQNIELIVKTATQETSIEQQIEIIEEMISAKVDAIVVAPGDSQRLIPVLKKAQDAGIRIVNIDNRLDTALMASAGLSGVPFISVDNDKAAYAAGKYLSDHIKTPTEVVILEGIRSAANAQLRKAGAERALAANSNVTIVASESANWKIDEAHDLAAKLFAQHPHIGAVFCANDMMALGVVKYLQETDKHKVLVEGFDALDEAVKATKEGQMLATVDQQASEQGYRGAISAINLLHGEKVAELVEVNAKLVTK